MAKRANVTIAILLAASCAFLGGALLTVPPSGGAPAALSPDDKASAPGPSATEGALGVKRADGTLHASAGSPTGHVLVGPTSRNHVGFEAGPTARFLVAEVRWESVEVHELGAVLFRYEGNEVGYGHTTLTTDLDWRDVDYVTGPSPLFLRTPLEPDARYRWSVYPLPDQRPASVAFEVALSFFAAEPPADHRVFAP